MGTQILDKIIESFIEFSLTEREALYKILIILIFLLFLVRKNNKTTGMTNKRKQLIVEAFNYLDEKIVYRGEYKIPEHIENKLIQRKYDKASILMLVADIMKHMGLPNRLPGISVYDASTYPDAEPGRCHMYGDGTSNIVIHILPEYDIDIVAAIVIHECMHHYLNVKRMRYQDRDKNEILTDMCGVYSGFGEIMYRGYKSRAVNYRRESKIHKLGYLTQNEIRYIMKKIS